MFIIIFTTDDSCNRQTVLLYTCPVSSIKHESLACGLETSISGITDNFSRLTHKSRQIMFFNTRLITKIQFNFHKNFPKRH